MLLSMPQEFEISEDDIRYAEKILLPSGKKFDPERVNFISKFKTIDLQAVPGSGKTTALLAKLIILERKLPFADGSGILVLSHTNAAIDEIKEKIQKHCPRLFSYPNFFGTIQSFVDQFLAVPYYKQIYKKRPVRIDEEIYNEKIKNFIDSPFLYKLEFENAIHRKVTYMMKNNSELFYNYRFKDSKKIILVNKLNGSKLEIKKPKGKTKPENYEDYTEDEKIQIYKWFLKFKQNILESGLLHFDDAYFLAERYIKKYPQITFILQKRFKYVFVDEMQDMDTHQYDLLERIFYDDGNSTSILQRIGDPNQAIYSPSNVKEDEVWQLRTAPEKVLRLKGSQRLSKPIAEVVKKFALYKDDDFDIEGLNDCTLKPHILLFNENNHQKVIQYFAQLVKEYKEAGSLKSKKDFNDVKVICWNTDWKEEVKRRNDSTKLRLKDYCDGFSRDKNKPKNDYDNLLSYLIFYEKKKTLEPIRKNILNAFLKILRLENINTPDERPYTKKKLIDFIRDKDIQKYDELNLNLYNWSIGIIHEKTKDVWESIKNYIPTLFHLWGKTISKSKNFINDSKIGTSNHNPENATPTNVFKYDELEIEITSVHAVKGQTHCATLYLESFYKNGYGNYESERLRNQFVSNQSVSETLQNIKNSHEYIRQSAKMAYVGFSRPTDLLCIAIHRDRFDNLLTTIDKDIWEIRIVE